jgi:hypothetical protein
MTAKISRHYRHAPQPEHKPAISAFEPMKPRPYGDTKTVVMAAIDQAGGVKLAADFLQRSISTVYGYTDPQAERCDMSLDQARRLTQYRGVTAFAEDFAALAGGSFVPADGPHDKSVGEYTAIANRDVSNLVGMLMAALEDGRIDDAERAALLPVVDDLHRDVTNLRNRLRACDRSAKGGRDE